jgi:hypothetical protein
VKIATQALTNAGTDDTSAVTPLKLATLLNNRVATELATGLIQIATQSVVNIGTDDQKAVSPLKLKVRLDNYINRESLLTIAAAHIGTSMYHTSGRNRYSVMNGNLVLIGDVRLKRAGGAGSISAWILNFPKPLNNPTGSLPGTLLSNHGELFSYWIDHNGKVFLSGTFVNVNDELLFNIKPYVAQHPIVYNGASPP